MTYKWIYSMPIINENEKDKREAYLAGVLQSESERLIASTQGRNVLVMRHIQSQCDGIRRRVKSPLVAARMIFDRIQGKFDELRRALE